MARNWIQGAVAVALCGATAAALAQSGPAGIPVGPLLAYPGVDVVIGHDDNLFLNNANRKKSAYTTVTPSVKFAGKTGPHTFDVTASVTEGRFHSSREDDYTDWSLLGNAGIVFSGRANLKLRAEHRYGHDPRGSTDRPAGNSPDEYTNTGVDGVFSYGAQGAKGRIEVEAGAFSREYQNNRASTAASDRDTRVLGGAFYWRVAPKTELLVGTQFSDIDYQLATSTLSSTERRFFIGAKWDATAKTSGTFKFGRLAKRFDSGTRADYSTNSSWDAGIRWSPLTYSVFDLATSKSTGESSGVGDFLLTKNHTLTWTHAWNSRFSTALNGGLRYDDFEGTGGGRRDKTTTLGAKATYQWQRWLRFGAEYTRSDRKSNGAQLDYDRDLFMLFIGATL